ncbi:MAG: S9 family peptidase [Erythrobacter sp.]|nr:S9 family peptidase [Erythrobacter sp.]MBO6528447.1 S9 family peptidase [Erythrobacter sp.]
MAVSLLALGAGVGGQGFVSSANAETVAETAARYGTRASVLNISLSPSGNKLAWIAAGPEHSEVLRVIDFASGSVVQTIANNTEITGDLESCEWATETRLVCEVAGMERTDGILLPYNRMFAIDYDGSNVESLYRAQSWRSLGIAQSGGVIVALDIPGEEGRILMTRDYHKEWSAGTRMASDKEGRGVDSVDVETGRRRSVESPDAFASRYLADENGNVRVKTRMMENNFGEMNGTRVILFRKPGEKGWERLDNVTLDGTPIEEFHPAGVDSARNALLAYHKINGYEAVIEIALDGTGVARKLAARDDADVAYLIRIGRQRRVVGVSYATERHSFEYFDPELAKLSKDLGAALPDQPLVNIVGANADESRLIVIASSDTDPGMVYLYDKNTRQLERLLAMRDYLVDQPMGNMTPITFPASDGTQIPAYLTLPPGSEGKNLPAIVLPHGGPSSRDYWGFDWLVQFFTARGYAVLQPNYRGSSGFGEAWYGRNGFQAWDIAIGDVADAGRWLVSEGVADPDKLAIAGWSYGGYAALQSQVVAPDLYKAVVAIAPVTDLGFLISDAQAYKNAGMVEKFVGSGPHLREGSPLRHAAKFESPVALFHGTLDLNVDVRHSREMADRLGDAGKSVSYTEYEDLQHSLSDSKVRTEMLTEIDAFLSKALGT